MCCYKLQEMSAAVIEGNDAVTGHIISTTIGGKNGEPKRVRTCSCSLFWGFKDLFELYIILNSWLGINHVMLLFSSSVKLPWELMNLIWRLWFYWYTFLFWVKEVLILSYYITVPWYSRFFLLCSLQTISYMAERVVGTGSFGIVFQVCTINMLLLLQLSDPRSFIPCKLYLWFELFSGKVLGNWRDCGYKEGVAGQAV